MDFWKFAIIIAVFMAVGAFFRRRKNAKKAILFQQLASELNLEYIPKRKLFNFEHEIKGKRNNTDVSIYDDYEDGGSEDGGTWYTYIEVSPVPQTHKFGFRIGKEGFFSKIGNKIGIKDIQFDRPEVDDVYRFKSKNEEAFRTIITADILNELYRIQNRFRGELKNSGYKLTYKTKLEIKEESHFKEIKTILAFMLKLNS